MFCVYAFVCIYVCGIDSTSFGFCVCSWRSWCSLCKILWPSGCPASQQPLPANAQPAVQPAVEERAQRYQANVCPASRAVNGEPAARFQMKRNPPHESETKLSELRRSKLPLHNWRRSAAGPASGRAEPPNPKVLAFAQDSTKAGIAEPSRLHKLPAELSSLQGWRPSFRLRQALQPSTAEERRAAA